MKPGKTAAAGGVSRISVNGVLAFSMIPVPFITSLAIHHILDRPNPYL